MRMWNVDTRTMCRQHLLGEHLEMHMFAGSLIKGANIEGYLNGLVETNKIAKRHKALVNEMKIRGYNHRSPLPQLPRINAGFVDNAANILELRRRCKECKRMQNIMARKVFNALSVN